jgi:hypothetical protein
MQKKFIKTLEAIAVITAGLALPVGLAVYNHYNKIQEPTWAVDVSVALYYGYVGLRFYRHRKKLREK